MQERHAAIYLYQPWICTRGIPLPRAFAGIINRVSQVRSARFDQVAIARRHSLSLQNTVANASLLFVFIAT
jgi:hypothetical protein